jgi:hypothetical protein
LTLKGEDTQGITCLQFSPDGKVLASRSQEGVVTFWPADAKEDKRAAENASVLLVGGFAVSLSVVFAIWIIRRRKGTRRNSIPVQKQIT